VSTTDDRIKRGLPRTYSSQTRVIPITDTYSNGCDNDCWSSSEGRFSTPKMGLEPPRIHSWSTW